MRVLLANKYYARRGGAESVVLQTQRLLEAAGHEVVPFAMHYDTNLPTAWSDYFVPGREYFEGSLRRRVSHSLAAIYSFDARKRVRALLRAARPDVAHLHNVYHQLTLSIIDELRAWSIPIVMTLHDYKAACPNYQLLTHDGLCSRCVGGSYWNAVRHRCLKGSIAGSAIAAAEAYLNRLRRQYDKIDVYVAPSRFLRDVMFRAGLPAARIAVLPNAVPVAARPRAVPAQPRFTYFGRLSSEKGIDTLLDASGRLPGGVEITLVGGGPLEKHVRGRVRAEGLPVSLTGIVPPEVVDQELEMTTAAVLPSECFENCPMSILEAGGLGVPTIASEIGGIPELISTRVDGVLVPPGDHRAFGDAITELARDPELVGTLGGAMHTRVSQRHNEDSYADALVAHYEHALRRHRTRVRAS